MPLVIDRLVLVIEPDDGLPVHHKNVIAVNDDRSWNVDILSERADRIEVAQIAAKNAELLNPDIPRVGYVDNVVCFVDTMREVQLPSSPTMAAKNLQ